jgi:orotate phosphoribosyltransferase/uridine monophosphate synthetase
MQTSDQTLDNLWLARALWDLGAVSFGDFKVGNSAIRSPIFINPKLLISSPTALRVAAKLMEQEVTLAQSMRHPRVQTYDVVAGVPVGGLLLATAFSLETNTPLIYARLKPEGTGPRGVEGHYMPGARALLIDDLATGGSGMLETVRLLAEFDVVVRDSVVLIDRGLGSYDLLKQQGINVIPILKLEVMINYYLASGLIDEAKHQRYLAYVHANQQAAQNFQSPTA